MINNSKLSFEVVPMENCKLIGIMDTSYYNPLSTPEGFSLLVATPWNSKPVELNYYKSGITILNSNNLGITNVAPGKIQNLPDGIYVAKISICPYEEFWYEKKWFRTCQLECRFWKAFLKLKISECDSCLQPNYTNHIDAAYRYIQGVKANITDCNFPAAQKLYNKADEILKDLSDDECDCGCK